MNKTKLPEFIIHYSRGEPFRTLTRFPQNEWQNIIETLNPKNAWGLNRFSDSNYLKQRIQVEDQLLNAFIAKGGEPILK